MGSDSQRSSLHLFQQLGIILVAPELGEERGSILMAAEMQPAYPSRSASASTASLLGKNAEAGDLGYSRIGKISGAVLRPKNPLWKSLRKPRRQGGRKTQCRSIAGSYRGRSGSVSPPSSLRARQTRQTSRLLRPVCNNRGQHERRRKAKIEGSARQPNRRFQIRRSGPDHQPAPIQFPAAVAARALRWVAETELPVRSAQHVQEIAAMVEAPAAMFDEGGAIDVTHDGRKVARRRSRRRSGLRFERPPIPSDSILGLAAIICHKRMIEAGDVALVPTTRGAPIR